MRTVIVRSGQIAMRRPRRGGRMGDIFGDVASAVGQVASAVETAVTHPADDVSDVAGAVQGAPGAIVSILMHPADDASAVASFNIDDVVNVWKALPGFNALTPDLQAFIDGPLRDAASNDVVKFLLQANATANYALLVPFLGPQLAAIAFAEPGFLAGDSFGQAWAVEFINRLQQTIHMITAGQVDTSGLEWPELPASMQDEISSIVATVSKQVQSAQDFLKTLGLTQLSQLTYDALAKQLNIRLDAAAAALVHLRNNPQELAAYAGLDFNPFTGELVPKDVASAAAGVAAHPVVLASSVAQTKAVMAPTSSVTKFTVLRPTAAIPAYAQQTAVQLAQQKIVPLPAPPAPVHPAVSSVAPHQAVVAAAPATHTATALSTPAKVGLVGAAITGLTLAAKFGGLF